MPGTVAGMASTTIDARRIRAALELADAAAAPGAGMSATTLTAVIRELAEIVRELDAGDVVSTDAEAAGAEASVSRSGRRSRRPGG